MIFEPFDEDEEAVPWGSCGFARLQNFVSKKDAWKKISVNVTAIILRGRGQGDGRVVMSACVAHTTHVAPTRAAHSHTISAPNVGAR